MNASRPVTLLAMAILPAHTNHAIAHRGNRVFPIYEIPFSAVPTLDDESLEDWEGLVLAPSLTTSDFAMLGGEVSPYNFAVRVFLAWEAQCQCLFVGVERLDDVLQVDYSDDSAPVIYMYDGMGFFVDGDHTGGQYPEGNQAQGYYVMTGTPTGHRIWSINEENGVWAVGGGNSALGAGITDGNPSRVVIEMEVTPWDSAPEDSRDVRSRLVGGAIIGFMVWFSDSDDGSGRPEGVYSPIGVDQEFGGEWLLTADAFLDGLLGATRSRPTLSGGVSPPHRQP